MKPYLFVLLSCFLLYSCIFDINAINAHNKKAQEEFVQNYSGQVGKATNCDVPRNVRKNKKIIHNNDQYSYVNDIASNIPQQNASLINNNINNNVWTNTRFTFENNILCGVEFPSTIAQSVNKCKKNYGDSKWISWDDSKYKYIDIAQNPEVDIKKLDYNEFIHKVTLGMKKGTLFRLIGKPNYSSDIDGGELVRYVVRQHKYENRGKGGSFLGSVYSNEKMYLQ